MYKLNCTRNLCEISHLKITISFEHLFPQFYFYKFGICRKNIINCKNAKKKVFKSKVTRHFTIKMVTFSE